MKKLLKSLLVVSALGMLTLTSCKKNDVPVTATSGKAGALTVSNTSITLSKTDTTNNPILTFTITPANYGYKGAVVTNTIQIDTVGDNWAHPVLTITLATNATTQSYTTAQLNSMALGQFKIAAGKTGNFNVRLEQTIGTTVAPIYSAVVPISITPYSIVVPETYVYVVGAFQGWSTNTPDSLASKDGVTYTGVIYFAPDNANPGQNQFLILPAKSFSTKFATAGGADTTGTSSTYTTEEVTAGGNNFVVKTQGGYYLLTLNVKTNMLTLAPADSYSLIGSAAPGVAWTTDTQMKFVNDGTNTWVLTAPMTVGEYKFRLDDAWTTSWGPGAAANSAVTSGAVGDGNMQLTTAGTYKLTLVQPPTVLGGSVAPLGTTTYTAVKQ